MHNDVVICGWGAVTPAGLNHDYIEALRTGRNCLSEIPEEVLAKMPDKLRVKTWGRVPNDLGALVRELGVKTIKYKKYDPDRKKIISNERSIAQILKHLERYHALAFIPTVFATRGLNLGTNVGLYAGSGIGGVESYCQGVVRVHKLRAPSPHFIADALTSIHSAINCEHDIEGPTHTNTGACGGGLYTLYNAFKELRSGYEGLDCILLTTAEAPLTPEGLSGFAVSGALSKQAKDLASRPFDKDRDGFVLAEAGAAVTMATQAYAEKQGLPILAKVLAGYCTQDMNPELTAPPPDGNGVYRCMKGALDRAGLNPEDIDLVIAHGTSTPHGDEAEVFAILQLFKGCGGYRGSNTPPIISTKGIVGHTIATSGIVSVIAAKDAMLKGYIPGNNVVNIDPRFKYADIVTEKRENQNIKYVLINACAFGGQNVSIVLEKP